MSRHHTVSCLGDAHSGSAFCDVVTDQIVCCLLDVKMKLLADIIAGYPAY